MAAADRRGIIVPLVILAFIFLSPDPVRPPRQFDSRPTIQDVIVEEQRSLAVVQDSTFQKDRFASRDAIGLNLTGLEAERGYTWDALPAVQGRARRWLAETVVGLGHEEQEEEATPVTRALSLEPLPVPLYKNVTGFVHGKWVRSTLETPILPPNINLSDYAPDNPFGGPRHIRPFGRNITGEGGDIRVRFHERQAPTDSPLEIETSNATQISVEMTITDSTTSDQHELRVFGVYFPTIGQALLTTTSDKFAGIFALPHLALSSSTFEASRLVLNDSISRGIQRQIDSQTDKYNPWSSRTDGSSENPFTTPECELIVYLQQLSHPSSPSDPLAFLERELRFPTGAFLPPAPPLHFALTAFSPDCGYVLESRGPPSYIPQEGNHLEGPKLEVLYLTSRRHILAYTLILALQLTLLIRQMREASTPSTRSRLSYYTIALLCLGDGFVTMSFMLVSLFIGVLWINLVATAFLAFVSVSFFGMRFLMDVWGVQAPERERVWREELEVEREREQRWRAALERLREEREERARLAAEEAAAAGGGGGDATTATTQQPNSPAPTTQPPAAPTLPSTTTTPRPPTTTDPTPLVFMPSDQASLLPTTTTPPSATTNPTAPPPFRESFAALYTRFYLLLLLTLFLTLNATTWPPPARRTFFLLLSLLYTSFWLPTIKRNILRNCRRALTWEFVLGQSVLRVLPLAYLWAWDGNVLFSEQDYWGLGVVAGWIWCQVVVLGSQEVFGARWFLLGKVGKGWAPEAWDYHRVLREDEEGADMPVGVSQVGEEAVSVPGSPVDRRGSLDVVGAAAKRRDSNTPLTTTVSRSREKEGGRRTFDCAICMQTLTVPVLSASSSAAENAAATGLSGSLARRAYMVTPCRHIFHSACLEGWMKYRLQCPICRETIPVV